LLASDVSIQDIGNIIVATNVEDALQEIDAQLAENVQQLANISVPIDSIAQITTTHNKPSFVSGGLDCVLDAGVSYSPLFFPKDTNVVTFKVQNGNFMCLGGDANSWTALDIGPDPSNHGCVFEFTPAGWTNLGLMPGGTLTAAPAKATDLVRVSVSTAGLYTIEIQRNGVGAWILWKTPFDKTAIAGGTGWTKNSRLGWCKFYAETGTPLVSNISVVVSLQKGMQQGKLLPVNRWDGMDWNPMGDSITNFFQYQPVVQSRLGVGYAPNLGIGGSCLASNDAGDNGSFAYRVGTMSNKAGLVTVFGGTNDYGHIPPKPLGVLGDTVNTTVFGAIDKIINTIITTNPMAKFGFITPLQRNYTGAGLGTTDIGGWGVANSLGYKLIDVADAIIAVCAIYGVPVLDLYRKSGITNINASIMLRDGLHPSDVGFILIGHRIATFIDSL